MHVAESDKFGGIQIMHERLPGGATHKLKKTYRFGVRRPIAHPAVYTNSTFG